MVSQSVSRRAGQEPSIDSKRFCCPARSNAVFGTGSSCQLNVLDATSPLSPLCSRRRLREAAVSGNVSFTTISVVVAFIDPKSQHPPHGSTHILRLSLRRDFACARGASVITLGTGTAALDPLSRPHGLVRPRNGFRIQGYDCGLPDGGTQPVNSLPCAFRRPSLPQSLCALHCLTLQLNPSPILLNTLVSFE